MPVSHGTMVTDYKVFQPDYAPHESSVLAQTVFSIFFLFYFCYAMRIRIRSLALCVTVFSSFQENANSDFGHGRSRRGTNLFLSSRRKTKKKKKPASTPNTIVSIWASRSHIKTKNRGKYFIRAVSAGVSRHDAWQIIEK